MTVRRTAGATSLETQPQPVQAYSPPSLKPRDSKPAVSMARDSAGITRVAVLRINWAGVILWRARCLECGWESTYQESEGEAVVVAKSHRCEVAS